MSTIFINPPISAKGIMDANKAIEDAAKVVGGLGTGIAATLGFIKWWNTKRSQKRAIQKVSDGVSELRSAFQVMEEVVHHRRLCDRSIVFAAHNDGGYPSLTCPYYASAVHWVTIKEESYKRISDYRNLPVDSAYIKMVGSIIKEGHVLMDYGTMEPGILKDIYELENVGQSLIVLLGIKDKKLFYMGFARFKDGNKFTVGDITRLKLAAHTVAEEMLK